MSNPWINYSESPPDREGPFEWRVKSKALDGEFVVVLAQMQWRNAGFDKKLAPNFAHWNGYNLIVPAELQWRDVSTDAKPPKHGITLLDIEGIQVIACPFCKKVPRWNGSWRTSGGGIVVLPPPQNLNAFWLECCAWVRTPHTEDPRKMVDRRNALLTELEKDYES